MSAIFQFPNDNIEALKICDSVTASRGLIFNGETSSGSGSDAAQFTRVILPMSLRNRTADGKGR